MTTAARQLWYDAPAGGDWNRALPLGNGRLAAMVFGDLPEERLQLNEESLWSGGPRDRTNPDARANLDRIRELIFAGQLHDAETLAREALTGIPPIMRHYEPLADLLVTHRRLVDAGPVRTARYRRDLDLDRASAGVSFTAGGHRLTQTAFVSAPHQVIAVRLATTDPNGLDLQIRLERGDRNYATRYFDEIRRCGDDSLLMLGRAGGRDGIGFAVQLAASAEPGTVTTLGESLLVRGAPDVVLLVAGHTTYRHADIDRACRVDLLRAREAGWDRLLAAHLAEHRAWFTRVDLELPANPELAALPTDRRLAAVAEGADDPALAALYFHFARYLLLGSSRPGCLAANLQGKWNGEFSPPWGSKYTININTEMNYWPAEVADLGECCESLFDLVEGIRRNGTDTARRMYGCRGFVCHHNTDLWHDTWPTDRNVSASNWPMGGAWLTLHLWDHYRFTGNRQFLARAYPTLRDAALFFVDFLVPDPQGRLVTCPTVSPENKYRLPNGQISAICAGATMDIAIVDCLFRAAIAAADILDRDPDLRAELAAIRDQLPPLAVGPDGRLMEWPDAHDEIEPGHRHISHLFALHPGDLIQPDRDPELAAAARQTLAGRLEHGGGGTGWSRAWIVNFFARLHDGEQAHHHLRKLLAISTYPNLLDAHPPFQIDGNLGGAAGIAEMLLQSHGDALHLLPALPPAWPTGSCRNLKARGALSVSMAWANGVLAEATVTAKHPGVYPVRYGETTLELELDAGEAALLLPAAFA